MDQLFNSPAGLAVLAIVVPVGGFILSMIVRFALGRLTSTLFGNVVGWGLNKPIKATMLSMPTGQAITLRQILNGNLGHGTGTKADPAARIKVLEDLHAQGGLTAAKLAKLKAAIEAGD